MKWEPHLEPDTEFNLYGDEGQYYGFLWKSSVTGHWCFKLAENQHRAGAIFKATTLEEAQEEAVAYVVANRLD